VEQKLVVKTPSCATNVSDHSSVGLCGTLKTCVVFCLDLPREIELFLRLSCAAAPTLSTLDSTGSISNDIFLSVSFGLVGSILHAEPIAEDVEAAELLLLLQGDSVQSLPSLACNDVEKFGHRKQTLRKSGLCVCVRILILIVCCFDCNDLFCNSVAYIDGKLNSFSSLLGADVFFPQV